MINHYIFHIGRAKTGSTSLCKALNLLGIPCSHNYNGPHGTIDRKTYEIWESDLSKNKRPNFEIVKYKAFTDHRSLSRNFIALETLFDDAKFILTARDSKSWIESRDHHNYLVNGCYLENKDKVEKQYKDHISNIKKYFENKPNKLLIMNIIDGDGYEKLCPFLNIAMCNQSFPHENKRKK